MVGRTGFRIEGRLEIFSAMSFCTSTGTLLLKRTRGISSRSLSLRRPLYLTLLEAVRQWCSQTLMSLTHSLLTPPGEKPWITDNTKKLSRTSLQSTTATREPWLCRRTLTAPPLRMRTVTKNSCWLLRIIERSSNWWRRLIWRSYLKYFWFLCVCSIESNRVIYDLYYIFSSHLPTYSIINWCLKGVV